MCRCLGMSVNKFYKNFFILIEYMGEGFYLGPVRYDRKKDRSEEDQRVPLYLPVPPPPNPERAPYKEGEGLEIRITPDDEKEDGIIVIDL